MTTEIASIERCVVYTRRPIHRYGQELDTYQQTDICMNFCQANGFEVAGQFCDYSRTVTDASELWKMLKVVEERGDIKYIVVADRGYIVHTLRWSRMAENFMLSDGFKNLAIIDVLGNSTMSFVKLCEEVRSAKAKKVSDTMKSHAKAGKWMGRPPGGYRAVKIVELRKDEKYRDVVSVALTMKIYSTARDQSILKWCRDNDMMINLVTLRAMFSNPVYCGRMRTEATEGEVIEAQHEGYITYEEYLELQEIIKVERLSQM